MVLHDFQCSKCDLVHEEYVSPEQVNTKCPSCQGKAKKIYLSVPKAVGLDEFNAHYDIQLGKYFSSADEKKKFLKDTGKLQEGTMSPRKSSRSRIICSREQAKRFDALDFKQSELD